MVKIAQTKIVDHGIIYSFFLRCTISEKRTILKFTEVVCFIMRTDVHATYEVAYLAEEEVE